MRGTAVMIKRGVLRKYRAWLRPTSMVVLFFMGWQFLQVPIFVAWAQEPPQAQTTAKDASSASKFTDMLAGLEQSMEKATRGLEAGTDVDSTITAALAQTETLNTLNAAIEDEFDATGRKLKEIKADSVIWDRQKKAVSEYKANFKELKSLIGDVSKNRKKPAPLKKSAAALLAFLKAKKPKSTHVPLDPNKLPHRAVKARKILPKLTPEEYEKDERFKPKVQHGKNNLLPQEGIQIASTSDSLAGMLPTTQVAALPAPVADDLAETIEVKFTDAIRAKAVELHNQPLEIYNWVRNNIEFVPTYGSIQGADYCLQTKQGNAFDTASLLIALLRVSNIPARYVYGTIEIPADKAMNWVGGVQKPELAVEVLNAGGIPAVGVLEGSVITKIRLEHVWVEAFVDYIPSRGAVHKVGDTWVPMDASFKQYEIAWGIDFFSLLPANGGQFLREYISEEGDSSPAQLFSQRVFAWVEGNLPSATRAEIFGRENLSRSKPIVPVDASSLASSMQYEVMVIAGRYSWLGERFRYTLTFEVYDEILDERHLVLTICAPDYCGKRITFAYKPATTYDEGLILQYGGNMLNVPPYLLNVVPIFMVEGREVAAGSGTVIGYMNRLTMTMYEPNRGSSRVDNLITVGSYAAISIETQKVPVEVLAQRLALLRTNSINSDRVTMDDLLGELLYDIGISYFHHLGVDEALYAQVLQLAHRRVGSEAMTSLGVIVDSVFGVPISARQGGFTIDVDKDVLSVSAVSGDREREISFMYYSGISSSAWESRVFQTFFDTPTISAIDLIRNAKRSGQEVLSIDSLNLDDALSRCEVSIEVISEIRNAVSAGLEVIVPRSNSQYEEWYGTGYIVIEEGSGVGAYMISGGLSGGGTAKALTSPEVTLIKSSLEYNIARMIFSRVVVLNAVLQVGMPYVSIAGDVDPEDGFDCSELTKYIYGLAGYTIPRTAADQYRHFSINGMIYNTAEEADLFFWKRAWGKIYHTGIVVAVSAEGDLTTVHAANPDRGVVLDQFRHDSPFWNTEIAGYGRPIGELR